MSRGSSCLTDPIRFCRNAADGFPSVPDNIVPEPDLERTQILPLGSQTQDETQAPISEARGGELKRKGSHTREGSVKAKKVKISLGPPVDLGD